MPAVTTPLVVMMTDFGWSSYVGVMKGVVLSICPGARLVDFTHDVTPQSVREGAWLLYSGYKFFPRGSIFLAVVDPGVGTRRKALAAGTAGYFFVGPDNGLLSPSLKDDGLVEIVELPVPPAAGPTFHGRDVFAPAAARIAAGVPLTRLGVSTQPDVHLEFYLAGRKGEVVYIDRFGNVITNLPPLVGQESYLLSLERDGRVYFEQKLFHYNSYASAPDGALFTVTGSCGTLEISIKNGSANRYLEAQVTDRVSLI